MRIYLFGVCPHQLNSVAPHTGTEVAADLRRSILDIYSAHLAPDGSVSIGGVGGGGGMDILCKPCP